MGNKANQYLGHPAAGGGIQLHSIGDIFPWDVIAYGDLNPVQWRATNHNTGVLGPIRSTIGEASADCAEYIYRAKLVAAVQRRGGLANWADLANDPCPVPANQPFASQRSRNDAITIAVDVFYVGRDGVASPVLPVEDSALAAIRRLDRKLIRDAFGFREFADEGTRAHADFLDHLQRDSQGIAA